MSQNVSKPMDLAGPANSDTTIKHAQGMGKL